MSNTKVAVIGAGPSGLAACKTLREFGLDYECLEAGEELGGIWNVEKGSGGYRSLQTNTSTGGMAYSDFPFLDDDPVYPNAQQMLSYFNRYVDHFQLRGSIRFSTRVIRAIPLAESGWRLELDDGQIKEYTSVVVATGQYTCPRLPHKATPGEFDGVHMHVADYLDVKTPHDLRKKRVIVVGLGSSAAELAAELCNPEASDGRSSQVILSARSGRWVLPKMVDGVPLDSRSPHSSEPLPTLMRALPGETGTWLARRAFAKVLRARSAKLGGPEALGLPTPTIQPWEDRPTMSIDFIPALQRGRIDVRPGIERFAGSTVHFTDGTHTQADAILYATGYQLSFPIFDRQSLGSDAPELALYQQISHPVHDQLFFIGCCRVMCALWPVAEQQSRWIAKLLTGSFKLPESKIRQKHAIALAKSLPLMCNFYVEKLRREAGVL
ncbi:MAG: cation diffusion facilitator CzcD-associated flavoprotein CzcO [Halioglobus sp.]